MKSLSFLELSNISLNNMKHQGILKKKQRFIDQQNENLSFFEAHFQRNKITV